MSWSERFRGFVKDVRVEITKVSWPTRNELRSSTVVVIATVLIVSAYIGLVDLVLNRLFRLVFR